MSRHVPFLRVLGVACLTAGLSACTALPRSGPDDTMIKAGAASSLGYDEQKVNFEYVVVDITSSILEFLDDGGPASLYRSFGGGKGGAPEILVGVGDTVQVTIFESSTGGLFVPADAGSRPGNYVTLPAQTVDRSGYVSVPYAGLVPAAGRSLPQIQQDIESRLENRAIEPQAVVALLSQKATEAAVVGEVNSPDKLAINPAGDRILDMISRAGGLKYAGHESFVTLQRRGKKATVYFNNLVQNPAENIYVAPGDTIYVYREQKSYLAFGATGMSGQFNFDTDKLSLAEAVGKAGGLLDARADPGQTFVYRLEERSALEKMGVDLAKFPADKTAVPTIYRANFRNPTSFFFSQKFQMRDKDVLYVSNADSVELIKFLTVVNSVSSTVSGVSSDALTTRNSIRGFKN